MRYVVMFVACYMYVLLRAFQQRNVAFDNYWWIVPTSYGMAVVDVFIVAFVAHQGWSIGIVFANGSGGALGAMTAMWMHRRWVKR